MLCRAVTRAFLFENGALYGDLYGHIYYCKRNDDDDEDGFILSLEENTIA
jgi:hypothetical protein